MQSLVVNHPAYQDASKEMIDVLRQLRKKVVVGFVGGSDLVKISEQLEQFGFSGAISHLSIPVLPDDI